MSHGLFYFIVLSLLALLVQKYKYWHEDQRARRSLSPSSGFDLRVTYRIKMRAISQTLCHCSRTWRYTYLAVTSWAYMQEQAEGAARLAATAHEPNELPGLQQWDCDAASRYSVTCFTSTKPQNPKTPEYWLRIYKLKWKTLRISIRALVLKHLGFSKRRQKEPDASSSTALRSTNKPATGLTISRDKILYLVQLLSLAEYRF